MQNEKSVTHENVNPNKISFTKSISENKHPQKNVTQNIDLMKKLCMNNTNIIYCATKLFFGNCFEIYELISMNLISFLGYETL